MSPSSDPDTSAMPEVGEALASPAEGVSRVAVEAREGEGFELWHEACRPVFDVARREPLARFDAALEFYEVDGLIFNRTRYSAVTFRRTPTHVRRGDQDPLVLHMLLRGGERGEVDGGGPLRMDPDRIVLHDWAQPYASISEASEQLCVVIPRERLASADQLYTSRPLVSWDLDSPSGRILGSALRETWHCLPQASRTDAPALAAGFLGLLDGFLDPARSAASAPVSDPATFAAMRDFMEDRLGDPALGIDDLTVHFRCSRSTIYRLFHDLGGVRTYLTELRLAKAFQMLTTGQGNMPSSIAAIAQSMGFRDASYFHRAFRKRYGITPKDAAAFPKVAQAMIATATDDSSSTDPLRTIHQWLRAGT